MTNSAVEGVPNEGKEQEIVLIHSNRGKRTSDLSLYLSPLCVSFSYTSTSFCFVTSLHPFVEHPKCQSKEEEHNKSVFPFLSFFLDYCYYSDLRENTKQTKRTKEKNCFIFSKDLSVFFFFFAFRSLSLSLSLSIYTWIDIPYIKYNCHFSS